VQSIAFFITRDTVIAPTAFAPSAKRHVHDNTDLAGIRLAGDDIPVKIEHVSWLLYLVGSLLVFGSWVDLVPTGVGWIGWLMALVGWAVGSRTRSSDPHTSLSTAEQIEKLDLLRQRNVITEEDFQQQKRRLLDHLQ